MEFGVNKVSGLELLLSFPCWVLFACPLLCSLLSGPVWFDMGEGVGGVLIGFIVIVGYLGAGSGR